MRGRSKVCCFKVIFQAPTVCGSVGRLQTERINERWSHHQRVDRIKEEVLNEKKKKKSPKCQRANDRESERRKRISPVGCSWRVIYRLSDKLKRFKVFLNFPVKDSFKNYVLCLFFIL